MGIELKTHLGAVVLVLPILSVAFAAAFCWLMDLRGLIHRRRISMQRRVVDRCEEYAAAWMCADDNHHGLYASELQQAEEELAREKEKLERLT